MVEKQCDSCKNCCCRGHGNKRNCKNFEKGRGMNKKQFIFIKDTVAPNLKTPIVFNNETMSIGEVLDKLNELSDENGHLKQENKKLQGEYDYLLWLYNGLGCEYDWLKEENEQLKKKNRRSYYIL